MSEQSAISLEESSRLVRLEQVIHSGKRTFVEVGEALAEIRDSKLYRSEFKTFEAYCQERWGWSRQNASYLIQSAAVIKELPANLSTMVDKERSARELVNVPAEDRTEVVAAIVESGKPVTNKTIREKAAEVAKTKPEPKSEEPKPDKPKRPPKLTPSQGMAIAAQAIRILEGIHADDLERDAALDEVAAWISKQR